MMRPTGFLRHNPETKFYSSEKLLKKYKGITGLVAVRSSAATLVSGFTDKPMPRLSISLLGALLGICLVTAAVEQSDAKVTPTTRSERCANLSHQFDEALETHATATQVTAARALQRKGNRYCAAKKQAQGIRMLANALKLLGVTPNDPVQ